LLDDVATVSAETRDRGVTKTAMASVAIVRAHTFISFSRILRRALL
jgi:hypothetical protein